MKNWWKTDEELMKNCWRLPQTTTDCHRLIGSTPLNTQTYLHTIYNIYVSLTPPTTRAPLAVLTNTKQQQTTASDSTTIILLISSYMQRNYEVLQFFGAVDFFTFWGKKYLCPVFAHMYMHSITTRRWTYLHLDFDLLSWWWWPLWSGNIHT